jgi:hypothetical protein
LIENEDINVFFALEEEKMKVRIELNAILYHFNQEFEIQEKVDILKHKLKFTKKAMITEPRQ